MRVKVFKVVEKEVEVLLPFYSHYTYGMLVFILLMCFIPITNYDLDRTVIGGKHKTK